MQQIISEADYLALINKAEHLQAENESLKQLLQEYQQIAMQKQKEWQQQETSSTEIASNLENQFIELESKKNYILDLLQQAEAAAQRENELENEVAGSVSVAHQLEDIKTQYDYLQAQLNDLSERLLELRNQNMLQMQSAGRIAELESLLANAEDEVALLKENDETA